VGGLGIRGDKCGCAGHAASSSPEGLTLVRLACLSAQQVRRVVDTCGQPGWELCGVLGMQHLTES
jgi:hypothetical protein